MTAISLLKLTEILQKQKFDAFYAQNVCSLLLTQTGKKHEKLVGEGLQDESAFRVSQFYI